MIQSMTGFGKAEMIYKDKTFTVEIRSLNSKNIDLKIRIPNEYREKELEIRKILSNRLKRGKIDFSLNVENRDNRPENSINENILRAYLLQLKSIQPDADNTALLTAALRLPDVLQTDKQNINEAEWKIVLQTIEAAVDKLIDFRKQEGQSLENDLLKRLENIGIYLKQIDELDANRLERKKERLLEALQKLQMDIDTNRFEQELIYYLEKFDLNEEKVRLQNHLDYFKEELEQNTEMKGKKLGFITQEMGREINTTGSKANDSDIQKLVVQMKDELEKIKEQVLNAL